MKGIICYDWEVRAFLAGRKTRLTRPMNRQPKHNVIEGLAHVTIGMNPADDGAIGYDADCIHPGKELRAPHRVGDLLYVKERIDNVPENGNWYYAADRLGVGWKVFYLLVPKSHKKCIAANAMPEGASRIHLRVTGVRAQRLGEMTYNDCLGEGLSSEGGSECAVDGMSVAQVRFMDHWNRTIGKRHPWDFNLWCWVYEVKRVEAES